MIDKKYDWEQLTNLLTEKYNYYHTNAPSDFKDLTFNEIIDFGEINGNIYENPIITALTLNEGKSLLNEAEYATYPLNTTINYVSRALNIPEKLFQKRGDKERGLWFILMKIFNDEDIKENVSKAMHLCGYYLATEKIYNKDDRFVILRYEPKYIDDGTYIVRQSKFLYHLSPFKYKDKILKNGFVPRSNNGRFNYPDRCYFFRDTMNKSEVLSWIPTFQKATEDRKDAKYCLYTIDVSKINANVVFYLDPNLRGGCYTADNISPTAIENIEYIQ